MKGIPAEPDHAVHSSITPGTASTCIKPISKLLADLHTAGNRLATSQTFHCGQTGVKPEIEVSFGLTNFLLIQHGSSAGPSTNWRWPFVIVALPSLLVTAVMLATVQEPPRGITEPALQVGP